MQPRTRCRRDGPPAPGTRRLTAPDGGGTSPAAGRSRERLLGDSCGRRGVWSPRRILGTSCSRTCGLAWARPPPLLRGTKPERRPRARVNQSRREFGCALAHSSSLSRQPRSSEALQRSDTRCFQGSTGAHPFVGETPLRGVEHGADHWHRVPGDARDLLVGLAGALRDHDGSGLQPPVQPRRMPRCDTRRGSDL